MIRTTLLTCVFVLIATAAAAEFYKYRDENGNLRFTDNISNVPESQREAVKEYESTIGSVNETPASSSGENRKSLENNASKSQTEAPAGLVKAEELNRMQAELHKTQMALKKEKADLAVQAPEENARSEEIIAYSMKVDALNSRIDQYTKDVKAFEEKVDAFNRRKTTN